MARHRDSARKPAEDDWQGDAWPYTIPAPEALEGGDSLWAEWEEASRRMDLAFAPTQPSQAVPLSGKAPEPAPAEHHPLSADALMVRARRNNRVCPLPAKWLQLYDALDGERYADLPPPPVQPWMWRKLSSLQKRLRFREHVEWAERHGRLEQLARFMDRLAEDDWLHMGEA
ncbi:MAG TPA: hypothetical protein VFM98_14795 [Ramlibacter sp.]|uniref:hypothetical protein n=1 Tax=Ramlibacter sp. TaxID=1917967 RepID=UPI002D8057A4|nr:hypothetical protein [Ramlibacter sp.]HET8746873.1 hypothetical protein [Ramlibacter sp.]